jgi:hypothetical protein
MTRQFRKVILQYRILLHLWASVPAILADN